MKQFKLILKPVAIVLLIEAIFMFICSIVAFTFKELDSFVAFLSSIGIILLINIFIYLISKNSKKTPLSIRSSFFLVVMVWSSVSLIGSLPFYLSNSIPNFADALFESVSGFTTTGASILSDIEALPQSMLLWRGITHWIGGGGIIVLSVAILPLLGIGGMQLMKAETSGLKVDKIAPRIAETAKYLWFLYIGITIISVSLLYYGGMGIIDALCHGFSAVSTGGLSTKNTSVGYFNSAFIDWVIIGTMFFGTMNFVLIIRLIKGQFSYLKIDSEFKLFFFIFIASSLSVSIYLYLNGYYSLHDAFRYGTFQTTSILTTTGFATTDYEVWPYFAQGIIFLLLFVGGSSGSTAGGVKIIRYIILFKHIGRELKRLLHPRAVFIFRINNEPAKTGLVDAVAGFFFFYIVSLIFLTVIVSASGVDVTSSFYAVLGTLSTVGPTFDTVGPTDNYGHFSDFVKYVLSFAMMLGRLEIYTLIVLFTKWYWKR